MRRRMVDISVHLIWGTWRRLPLISREMEPLLFQAVESKCAELGSWARAVGGTRDHVHVLARLNPAVSVARLVGEVKELLVT